MSSKPQCHGFFKVTLQLMASQSLCQGIESILGLVTRYYFLSESCFLKFAVLSFLRCPLWREVGSVIVFLRCPLWWEVGSVICLSPSPLHHYTYVGAFHRNAYRYPSNSPINRISMGTNYRNNTWIGASSVYTWVRLKASTEIYREMTRIIYQDDTDQLACTIAAVQFAWHVL
jgi:hypothetical protein